MFALGWIVPVWGDSTLQNLSGNQNPGDSDPVPTLPAVHAELEALEGQPFLDRVTELLRGEAQAVVLDALILRAGRRTPPGLTGASAQRRAARQREAQAWMRADERWFPRARDLIAAPQTDDDLRCAALHTLARSGQLRVAGDLAWVLRGQDHSTRVRECALHALLELTGRRFRDFEHFQQTAASWHARTRAGIFAEEFLASERENEALRIELLGLNDGRLSSALQHGSPLLRSAAAAAVARGVGRQGRSLDDALDLLFDLLDREQDPAVVHATLAAGVALLEGLPADSASVARMRELMTSPEFLDRLEVAPAVVDAIARLPWGEENGRATAAGLIAGRIQALADVRRPVDYEAVGLAVAALATFLAQDSQGDPAFSAASEARAVVLDLLRASVPEQVRLEAARAAGDILSLQSIGALFNAFDGADSERLRLELFGSIAGLAADLPSGHSQVPRLLTMVTESLSSPGTDLRRRAVDLLAGESLSSLQGDLREAGMAQVLVDRLGVEPVVSVCDGVLLALTGLAPAPDQARALVELPNFDALLDENHRRPERMALCLAALIGGDAEVTLRATRRMAHDQRETLPSSAPSGRDRLSAALRIAIAPEEAAVIGWQASDHGTMIGWALEVIAAGLQPDLAVLDRVVGLHLSHASGVARLDAARLFAARDLSRLAGSVERDAAAVEVVFTEALTEAGDGADRQPILVARARWRQAAGNLAGARVDWAALLFPGGTQTPVRGLAPEDQRRARSAFAGDALRAARLAHHLVTDPAWPRSETSTRLADLLLMVDLAIESRDKGLMTSAQALLEDVPEPVAGEDLPTFPAGHRWVSTVQRRADHDSLWRRVTALKAALEGSDQPSVQAGEDESQPAEEEADGEEDEHGQEEAGGPTGPASREEGEGP